MFLYYKWACREISPFSVIDYSVRIKEMRVCQYWHTLILKGEGGINPF